jgi:hypothetical protein
MSSPKLSPENANNMQWFLCSLILDAEATEKDSKKENWGRASYRPPAMRKIASALSLMMCLGP